MNIFKDTNDANTRQFGNKENSELNLSVLPRP
jgi:hypothetical protein